MVRGWTYLLALAAFAVLVFGETGNGSGDCVTPGGTPGKCVLVRECEYIRDILRREVHTMNDTEYVDRLQCGEQADSLPLVCCPRLQNSDICGPINLVDRILGGNETSIAEFPWITLLRFQARNGKIHANCGGSLISDRFVLTAAHCFTTAQQKHWKIHSVRVSEWNFMNYRGGRDCRTLPNSGATICRKDYKVARYTIHPSYRINYNVYFNDIALIELVAPVQFNEFAKPICLPLDDANLPPLEAATLEYTAAGWGSITPGSGMHETLMKVSLRSFDSDRCRDKFPVPSGDSISEVHVCAGGIKGQDTCHGDSGGPLTLEYAGAQYLVGITSFGMPKCGTQGVPGVYTNVSHLIGWIQYEVFRGITV